jgi:hypothetical protein
MTSTYSKTSSTSAAATLYRPISAGGSTLPQSGNEETLAPQTYSQQDHEGAESEDSGVYSGEEAVERGEADSERYNKANDSKLAQLNAQL